MKSIGVITRIQEGKLIILFTDTIYCKQSVIDYINEYLNTYVLNKELTDNLVRTVSKQLSGYIAKCNQYGLIRLSPVDGFIKILGTGVSE